LNLARPAVEQPVGRYQLAASGQSMLDTATGTLYRAEGDRWQVQATLPAPAGSSQPQPAENAPEPRGS
jgi:hypothetical protein